MNDKGTCEKHGEFNLLEGCPQCLKEQSTGNTSPRIREKLKVLKSLRTKELIEKMHQYEEELESSLREDASFKNLNYEYLASEHSDCRATKSILAELLAQAPDATLTDRKVTEVEKKTWLKEKQKLDSSFTGTIADAPETTRISKGLTEIDKKAWLERQRTENEELAGAINRQKEVSFLIDNNQISTDMAKRRLEGTRAVLALKTQQLAFLAS